MTELYRLSGSLALISMVGSFIILFSFFFVKSLRRHPISIIFWMAFCDFFFALKFFLTSVIPNSKALEEATNPFCSFQSAFAQFWGLGTIGWVGMISLNLILNLRNPFLNTQGYVKFYHLWVWGYAAAATIAMFATNQAGPSGDGTCWIAQNPQRYNFNWFQLTFMVPLMIYFLLSLMALFYASVRTREIFDSQSKSARQMMTRMSLFVLCFIIFWTGPVFHRIHQYYITGQGDADNKKNNDSVGLIYWDAISVSTQGCGNAIIWLSHPDVFKAFLRSPLALLWRNTADRVPLLNKIQQEIADSEDIQRLDVLLRKAIITSILLGVRRSLVHLSVANQTPLDLHRDNNVFQYRDLPEDRLPDLRSMSLHYTLLDYAPRIFQAIRSLCGISPQQYLNVLEPERFLGNLVNQKFSEGKSGSFFCFSPDKNFILKTIDGKEAKVLQEILPHYYLHFKKYPDSLLTRIYGLHTVKIQGNLEIHVIIMSNLFNTNRTIHEKYDLKGSWVARSVKEHAEDPSVLGKDLDMIQNIKLGPEKRLSLLLQLTKDTVFLRDQGIMDYSLLVGISFLDRENGEIVSSPTMKREEHQDISMDTSDLVQLDSSRDVQLDIREIIEEPLHGRERVLVSPGSSRSTFLQTPTEPLNLINEGIVSDDGSEVYLIGLIDILQRYNLQKKSERCVKIVFLKADSEGLSVQPVKKYNERFLQKMSERIV